jgi:predicted Zn-dependent protease
VIGADDLLALCKEALAEAGEAEAEICAVSRHRGFARFAVGELGQHMDIDEPLAAVRVAHGARVAEAGTSRLDRASLVRALRDAAEAARLVPETEGFPGFAGAGDALASPPRFESRTAHATAEERVAILAPAMGAIRAPARSRPRRARSRSRPRAAARGPTRGPWPASKCGRSRRRARAERPGTAGTCTAT